MSEPQTFNLFPVWIEMAKALGHDWQTQDDGTTTLIIPDHVDDRGNSFIGCKLVQTAPTDE